MTGRKGDGFRRLWAGLMQRVMQYLHGVNMRCVLTLVVGGFVLFLLFSTVCVSERYSLQVGSKAEQTIHATKLVEDTVTTEQRRFEAEQKVPTYYVVDESINEQIRSDVEALLFELGAVQQHGEKLREENAAGSRVRISTKDAADALAMITKTDVYNTLKIRKLMETDSDSFDSLCDVLTSAVEACIKEPVTAAMLERENGAQSEAVKKIADMCTGNVDGDLRDAIIIPLLGECIVPNAVPDIARTNQEKKEASDAVKPEYIQEGDAVVREGQIVTLAHMAMLEDLGLLNSGHMDLTIFGGALLLVAAAMFMLVLLLRLYSPQTLTDTRSLMVIMLVMVICQAMAVISVKLINVYLSPVALCAILLTGLLGSRIGVAGGLTMTVIITGLAAAADSNYSSEMVHLLMTGVVSTAVSAQFLSGKPQRVRAVVCGAIAAATNVLVILALVMMTAVDVASSMTASIWSMAGALLSGLIAVGFQPVFEAAFNLATPSKLLELSNPNQPLLKRLLMEAPGTYHHSIVVANLAEAAAEKIGANSLLARTGAYFHDVGKLKRPMYFKENQRGENPHDHTDAYVSAAIVTSHTRDGLQLAQRYHMPPEVQRIIVEHHGDTPVMYFYHKALQQANGKPVDVKDFRYGSSRPGTKESAIVMLADTIEAAVRSMPDPTPQSIQRFIERLVRGKIEDGQLSNSPLSLHDIDGICEAFSRVLSGVFHERIEYPTVHLHHSAGDAAAASGQTASAAQQKADVQAAAERIITDAMPEPYSAPMPDGILPDGDLRGAGEENTK